MNELPDYFRYWGKGGPDCPGEHDCQPPMHQRLCVTTVAGNKQ
ncbi:MAG: hypothetical protein NTX75_05965 [Proteobacteria bacterium]|nr:hypothetical protein [Pseudomonadota bacterium]